MSCRKSRRQRAHLRIIADSAIARHAQSQFHQAQHQRVGFAILAFHCSPYTPPGEGAAGASVCGCEWHGKGPGVNGPALHTREGAKVRGRLFIDPAIGSIECSLPLYDRFPGSKQANEPTRGPANAAVLRHEGNSPGRSLGRGTPETSPGDASSHASSARGG